MVPSVCAPLRRVIHDYSAFKVTPREAGTSPRFSSDDLMLTNDLLDSLQPRNRTADSLVRTTAALLAELTTCVCVGVIERERETGVSRHETADNEGRGEREKKERARSRRKRERRRVGDRSDGVRETPPRGRKGGMGRERDRRIPARGKVSDVGRRGVSPSAGIQKASRTSLLYAFSSTSPSLRPPIVTDRHRAIIRRFIFLHLIIAMRSKSWWPFLPSSRSLIH